MGIPYGRFTGRTFHCFRRTAARNLRNARVPQSTCMDITGHRSPSMFKRYAITNEADLADAMVKVQEHVAAQPSPAQSAPTPLRRAQST